MLKKKKKKESFCLSSYQFVAGQNSCVQFHPSLCGLDGCWGGRGAAVTCWKGCLLQLGVLSGERGPDRF